MRRFHRIRILGLAAACGVACFAQAGQPPVPAADIVPGIWQHHTITISFYGITSLYSCDGLEEQVRSILLHLGARRDAKVNAVGCPGGPEIPSHSAWIKTDFHTLQPAAPDSGAQTVRAYWAPRELRPQRPHFMGGGDCELVEQMKDLIAKSFAMRGLQYRTDCVPHEINLDGFAIEGEALLPAPPADAPG